MLGESIFDLRDTWRTMNASGRWRLIKPFVPALSWMFLAAIAFVSTLVCFRLGMMAEFHQSAIFAGISAGSWLGFMVLSGLILCISLTMAMASVLWIPR